MEHEPCLESHRHSSVSRTFYPACGSCWRPHYESCIPLCILWSPAAPSVPKLWHIISCGMLCSERSFQSYGRSVLQGTERVGRDVSFVWTWYWHYSFFSALQTIYWVSGHHPVNINHSANSTSFYLTSNWIHSCSRSLRWRLGLQAMQALIILAFFLGLFFRSASLYHPQRDAISHIKHQKEKVKGINTKEKLKQKKKMSSLFSFMKN